MLISVGVGVTLGIVAAWKKGSWVDRLVLPARLRLRHWIILFPGIFLAATVLAINLVGDGLRDLLDVR